MTDEKGEAEFEFAEDARLKTALCGALKEPVGSNDEQQPGYRPKAVALLAPPWPGNVYELTLTLDERGDPGEPTDAVANR